MADIEFTPERFTPLHIQGFDQASDQPVVEMYKNKAHVLSIFSDGRVVFGQGMTAEAESRAFWAQVANHYRGFREACIAAETVFSENMRKAGLL